MHFFVTPALEKSEAGPYAAHGTAYGPASDLSPPARQNQQFLLYN